MFEILIKSVVVFFVLVFSISAVYLKTIEGMEEYDVEDLDL